MSRARDNANLSPTIADARMPNLTGDITTVEGAVATTIATDAVDIAMLSASGTADGDTFLRGDNAWAAAGGSTSASDLDEGTLAVARMAAGTVIQVVMGSEFSGTDSTGSTSTSGVATQVYSTITPLLSSSKILVCSVITVGVADGGNYGGSVWMTRSQVGGETDVKTIVGATAGSRTRGTGGAYSGSGVSYDMYNISTSYLDTPTIPSTPVAITYKYRMKSAFPSKHILINFMGEEGDSHHSTRTTSYVTLLEIAG